MQTQSIARSKKKKSEEKSATQKEIKQNKESINLRTGSLRR